MGSKQYPDGSAWYPITNDYNLTPQPMKTLIRWSLLFVAAGASYLPLVAQSLRVSPYKRHLLYQDGTPFFYLGDTAWELFHRLDREEADTYLEDRAVK